LVGIPNRVVYRSRQPVSTPYDWITLAHAGQGSRADLPDWRRQELESIRRTAARLPTPELRARLEHEHAASLDPEDAAFALSEDALALLADELAGRLWP
jgi:hypothetical protein